MSDNVVVGDVWRDVDPRRSDRRFSIEAIVGEEAICKSLENPRQFSKIKLRRFIPKYYKKITAKTETPAQTVLSSESDASSLTNSLLQNCQNTIKGNWVELDTDVVKLAEDPFSVIIRKFEWGDKIGYDTKILVNGVITQTWVIYLDSLESAIADYVKSVLMQMKHSLEKML